MLPQSTTTAMTYDKRIAYFVLISLAVPFLLTLVDRWLGVLAADNWAPAALAFGVGWPLNNKTRRGALTGTPYLALCVVYIIVATILRALLNPTFKAGDRYFFLLGLEIVSAYVLSWIAIKTIKQKTTAGASASPSSSLNPVGPFPRRPCLTPILSGLDRNDSAKTRIKTNSSEESKTMPSTQPTINPIVAPATEPEPTQPSPQELEDRCYAQIAQELETNTVDKGVWTKAYAQAGGDDKQTRALYIKTRFDRLIAMEDARLETIRMNQSLERQKRIQQCESLLSSKGYKLIPKANGWLVKEPLGGRQPIETLEELEHYANSRQES